jgi:uncharacterized protein (DUF362 family)
MEGDGPLNGTAKELGIVLLSDDPVAADATLARKLGFIPNRIPYIRAAGNFLGNLDEHNFAWLS